MRLYRDESARILIFTEDKRRKLYYQIVTKVTDKIYPYVDKLRLTGAFFRHDFMLSEIGISCNNTDEGYFDAVSKKTARIDSDGFYDIQSAFLRSSGY